MIRPVSSALPVDLLLPITGEVPPAVEAAATLPAREADSATFSPEALEMLRASQETEGG